MSITMIDLNENCLDGWRPWTDDMAGEQNGWLRDQWCLLVIVRQLSGHCRTLHVIAKIAGITDQIPPEKVEKMVKELVDQGVIEIVDPGSDEPRYRFKKGAQLQLQFVAP